MDKRHLRVFLGRPEVAVKSDGPADVLYRLPNPDDSRKSCENCIMWRPHDQRCNLHEQDVVVQADMVCGYHLYGTPGKLTGIENLQPVRQEFSGLGGAKGGASCDTCTYYQAAGTQAGQCSVLNEVVDAFGMCTRWTETLG